MNVNLIATSSLGLMGEVYSKRLTRACVTNITSRIVHFAAVCLVLTLAACGGGGGGDGGGSGGTQQSGTVVGAAGGTVVGPNGAKVVIPAGALATNTTINIAQIAASTAVLPVGFSVSGQMFAFTPHGTTFAVPVTMTLPFNPALVPAGTTPQFYKTNAQFQWEQITNATFGTDTATAQVTSFSDGAIVIPPIVIPPLEPVSMLREWEFKLIPGSAIGEVALDGDTLLAGQLEEFATFGPAVADLGYIGVNQSFPADSLANGMIFSSPDGVTFGVFAEAPYNKLKGPNPIGSIAQLKQTQSFIKRAANATFKFTLTRVQIRNNRLQHAVSEGRRAAQGRGASLGWGVRNVAKLLLLHGGAGFRVRRQRLLLSQHQG